MGFLVVSSDKLGNICVRVDELVVMGDCNVEDLPFIPSVLLTKLFLSFTVASMASPRARGLLMWISDVPVNWVVGGMLMASLALLSHKFGYILILARFWVLLQYSFIYSPRHLYSNLLNSKVVLMQRFPKYQFLLYITLIILSTYMQLDMRKSRLYAKNLREKWLWSAYMKVSFNYLLSVIGISDCFAFHAIEGLST